MRVSVRQNLGRIYASEVNTMIKSRTLLATGIAAVVSLVGFSAHVVATQITGQTASVNVIAPITIAAGTNPLNFGDVSNPTAGPVTFTLDPTVALNPVTSASGDVVPGTATRADFALTGEASSTYIVDFTGNTLPMNMGSALVQLTALTSSSLSTGATDAGTFDAVTADDTLYVGGTISVDNTASGPYSANYVMDVVYN